MHVGFSVCDVFLWGSLVGKSAALASDPTRVVLQRLMTGAVLRVDLPLITLPPFFLPSFVHLLPLTPPWRLQQLLEEREGEEREDVVEEVEDARFVRASSLLSAIPVPLLPPDSASFFTLGRCYRLTWRATGSHWHTFLLLTPHATFLHNFASFNIFTAFLIDIWSNVELQKSRLWQIACNIKKQNLKMWVPKI